MRDKLQKQLINMRETLDENIKSIKSLLETSLSLGESIKDFKKKEVEKEILSALENTRSNIEKNLTELIKNTNDLFDTYVKMMTVL